MAPKYRFREQVRTEPIVIAALIGFAAIEVLLAVHFWRTLWEVGVVHFVGAALMIFMAGSFRALTITVSESELSFSFGLFRKRIKLAQIQSATITDATLLSTGIGIHITRDGYWAWVARRGAAARISQIGARHAGFIISTDRPRDLIAALKSGPPTDAPDDSYYAT